MRWPSVRLGPAATQRERVVDVAHFLPSSLRSVRFFQKALKKLVEASPYLFFFFFTVNSVT